MHTCTVHVLLPMVKHVQCLYTCSRYMHTHDTYIIYIFYMTHIYTHTYICVHDIHVPFTCVTASLFHVDECRLIVSPSYFVSLP